MSDQIKKPHEVIKELAQYKGTIKIWHRHNLELTYSGPLKTDRITFPLYEHQKRAFVHAVKSYENIIPIKIKKNSTPTLENINNIYVFNATKEYKPTQETFSCPETIACCIRQPIVSPVGLTMNKIDEMRKEKSISNSMRIVYNYEGINHNDFLFSPDNESSNFADIFRHELGHVLGLGHPKDHNTPKKLTVMSYSNQANDPQNAKPVTLGLYDTLVLQNYYGQNLNTNAGDTVYQWDSDEMLLSRCLWDASGNDTMDLTKSKYPCVLDMRDGEFSSIGQHANLTAALDDNLSIAYGVGLEKAMASDHGDTFFLNACDNEIQGGKGNDILYINDQFINTRVAPRNAEYTNQFVAKQNYLDRKQYRGWGHDVFYPGGGTDLIVLDVDPNEMFFTRWEKPSTGFKALTISQISKSFFSKKEFASSIVIGDFNPEKHVILVRCTSEDQKNNLSIKYSQYKQKAVAMRHRFKNLDKAITDFQNNQMLQKRINRYDAKATSISKKYCGKENIYLALSVE